MFTVEKLGCKAVSSSPVTVVVADGNKLQCDKMCVGLSQKMHEHEFKGGFLVLPLKGCQMVLEIQWLVFLCPIIWDFKQLRMEFFIGKKKVVLRRSPLPKLQLMQGKSLIKAL